MAETVPESIAPPPENATFAIILAAAGASSRFSHRGLNDPVAKKTFMHLDGKPVWLRSLEKFISRDDVAQLIIVVSPEDIDWFRKYYLAEINHLLLHVVPGGVTRMHSIRNGLVSVSSKVDFIAVHDAARPCVTDQEVSDVFAAAKQYGAALLASPIIGTIKKVVDGQIEATYPRNYFWEAQTPQVFRREMLIEAYQQQITASGADAPTDDAQLVERLGKPIHIVPTDRGNIKITTPADMVLAKHLVELGR